MIKPSEAIDIIINSTLRLETVELSLETAAGHVLAQDITTAQDVPPFDNSAMDGYAVIAADIAGASEDSPITLRAIDELPAGKAAEISVEPGTAVRIMTGAPVPDGADTVIQVEKTRSSNSEVEILAAMPRGRNIRLAGEEMSAGSLAVASGTLIDYVVVGILATLGYARVMVYRKPRVAILGTGSELVGVDEPLAPGKIRDSNSYALTAEANEIGVPAKRLGIAVDTREALKEALTEALDSFDAVVTSGGVSVGDYDFVKDVVEELGGELKFWGVKQKPGKPLAFWMVGDKPVFGLPGNPVASLLCFEEYVRPALLKMMGRHQLFRPVVKAKLTHDLKKKPGRLHFQGARVVRDGNVYTMAINGKQGSSMLRSIAGANGIAVIPADATEINAGALVEVQLVTLPEDH